MTAGDGLEHDETEEPPEPVHLLKGGRAEHAIQLLAHELLPSLPERGIGGLLGHGPILAQASVGNPFTARLVASVSR